MKIPKSLTGLMWTTNFDFSYINCFAGNIMHLNGGVIKIAKSVIYDTIWTQFLGSIHKKVGILGVK